MSIAKFLRGLDQFRASAIALILANLLPLFGVLFLKWDAFSIVALYWAENVVLGAINVLKMIACSPDEKSIDWSRFAGDEKVEELKRQFEGSRESIEVAKLVHHGGKLFLVPFFAVHYGFFCLIHGVFVFTLFGHENLRSGFGPFGPLSDIGSVFREQHLWWAVAALAASHLYSFIVNYIGRGEYRRTIIAWQMFQPYARVIVLHLAILFGGFVAMALGSNVGVLVILVLAKTVLDLHFHLLEHLCKAGGAAPDAGTVLDESPV